MIIFWFWLYFDENYLIKYLQLTVLTKKAILFRKSFSWDFMMLLDDSCSLSTFDSQRGFDLTEKAL